MASVASIAPETLSDTTSGACVHGADPVNKYQKIVSAVIVLHLMGSTTLIWANLQWNTPSDKAHPSHGSVEVVGSHDLRADSGLQANLTVDMKQPRVAEVLDHLRAATGLSLTVNNRIEKHQEAFGSLSVRNVPAWKIMDLLAASDAVKGHWEKYGDGYRLIGMIEVTPEQRPFGLSRLQVHLLMLIGVSLILACLLLARRRRARGTDRATA